jgi:hypothetical protein
MTFGRSLRLLALAASLALTSLPALADATLDFQLGGSGGGTINFAGGTGPLVGKNIPIRLVSGNDTQLNSGTTLAITNGILSFTTGNLLSYAGGLMTFAGTGTYAIYGKIPSIGITSTATPLVSGTLSAATYDVNYSGSSLFMGSGTDTKHPALISYFFNTPPLAWLFSGTVHAGKPVLLANNAFKQAVKATSVDFNNTAVPEVGSILMLGTSLLATAYLVRRRSTKPKS